MIEPIILSEGTYNQSDVDKLKQSKIWHIIDVYEEQLNEYFEIVNPTLLKQAEFAQLQTDFVQQKMSQSSVSGDWIYFPWSGSLVHSIAKNEYYQLRTNRNKNLITQQEQDVLHDCCIGLAGLSVGGSTALSLSYQGIANQLKLAELDSLSTSNLNRVRGRLQDIGLTKLELVVRQIYELDPHQHVQVYEQGLNSDNLEDFVSGSPKPRIIFEMIDDFDMKIKLRQAAKKAGIPVIVGANLGDSILIDIERYDTEPDTPLFNGVLGDLPDRILSLPDADKNQYAVEMVGRQNVPQRAMESVQQIGKSLVGRPQLSGTVAINGALAAYFARRIILNEPLPSGRMKLDFAAALQLGETG